MSDIAVTTIISTAAVIMAAALGYTLARLRDLRAQVDVQQHALEALAEPPQPEKPAKKRRHLYVVRGLLPLLSAAALAGLLRRHWRAVAGAATAAGAASFIAIAVIPRGPQPSEPHAELPPRPPGVSQTARTPTTVPTGSPSTMPGRTAPSRLPSVPLLPVRTRRPTAGTPAPVQPPTGPSASPRPSPPVRTAAPPTRPTGTATPTCLIELFLGKLVRVCI